MKHVLCGQEFIYVSFLKTIFLQIRALIALGLMYIYTVVVGRITSCMVKIEFISAKILTNYQVKIT